MGNLLYVKKCLGKDGRTIRIRKLRTMDLDADERLHEMGRNLDSYGHPISDPRITAVGGLLRKYWIDEIPQLSSLLDGDLKLVGIRPKSEDEWSRYPAAIKQRALRQRPGLLGVQYAYPRTDDFDAYVTHLSRYLDEWEEDPYRADFHYLYRILLNILMGARSS